MLLSSVSIRYLRGGLYSASAICIVLFGVFNLSVHRENPFARAVESRMLSPAASRYFCIDGDKDFRSPRHAKYAELLLRLEFGREEPVYYSSTLPAEATRKGALILTEHQCRKRLEERGIRFQQEQTFKKLELLRVL